jgi:hypothetical protein
MCAIEDRRSNILTIAIQPDDVVQIYKHADDNLLNLIQLWKNGLRAIMLHKVIKSIGQGLETSPFLKVLEKSGNIFAVLFDVAKSKAPDAADPSIRAALEALPSGKKIRIYIDDLDRGWQGGIVDIKRISALLNALRDLAREHQGLQFRLGLRSDVYYLVRTSDESTDKIDGSVIWLSWTNHEILALLVKRIETFFGRQADESKLISARQSTLARFLTQVMDPVFVGAGKWENAPMHRVLLSLIRQRPRDMVKLCTDAAREAYKNGHKLISTSDLRSVFEKYSRDRLQDCVNEYRTEMPNLERLLLEMKPSRREKLARLGYQFTTAQLLTKIGNIMEHDRFVFADGKRQSTSKALAQFLYKINFLTARRLLQNGEIDRKYFEENQYLSNDFVEFGYDWEIHPAYRWALQPSNVLAIMRDIELSGEV